MKKINKSVFRIDFQMGKAAEYFNDLLFEKDYNRKTAREETSEKYGFYTVHVVATTQENAIKKFEREFLDEVNNNGLTWLGIETIVNGNTF
jgi:hypothetical protein